ncbi:MAG: hypothetical protein RMJ66_00465 [Bacteroidia bacterium]|nr:hypothetical protein [Bacteroidia bacterium]
MDLLLNQEHRKAPTELYYYGPALHTEESRRKMQHLLRNALPSNSPVYVEVHHDLLGAARAAWGKQTGIVGILGTGSNCAKWSGSQITLQAGGHGYLLGDDGSGADLGRHFISALLHDEVPSEITGAFWTWIRAQHYFSPPLKTALDIRRLVYTSPTPSKSLAAFAPFLSTCISHEWIAGLVRQRLRSFVRRTWARWPSPRRIKYVGGIAQAFTKLLREITEEHEGEWHGVVENVAYNLLHYHVYGR